jgi:hypothetical protein
VAGVPRASESGGHARPVRDVADEVVAGAEGHGVAVSQHPPVSGGEIRANFLLKTEHFTIQYIFFIILAS